jgi:hypothetical protein
MTAACVIALASTTSAPCAADSTTLLFTFVTSQAGFDTGLFITNSTLGPVGSTPVEGSCVISYYGTNAPAPQGTGPIAGGAVYTILASTAAPGFQGYVIAVCAFPGASGGAFVSDLGATTFAAGYEARVLPTPEDSAATEETRDLEEALLLKRLLASFYLPAAQGGKLETIDLLVQDTIARVAASGESTNGAAQNLGWAHTAQSLGKFKEAFLQYGTAYCKAVSPVPRLSQCN